MVWFDVHEADPSALKPKLAMYANTVLADLHRQSVWQDRILIGKHGLDMQGNNMAAWYRDDFTGRFDGVHMYGSQGVAAYNKSVIQIIQRILPSSEPRSSFLSSTTASTYHNTCPQAQYQKRLKMNNVFNIPVRNQFEVLGSWTHC